MLNTESVRKLIDQAYDQFGSAMGGVQGQVDANQAAELARVGGGAARMAQGVEAGRQNVLGGISRIGNEANANTERSVADVIQSLRGGVGQFGVTPLNVGQPAPEYPELEPALDKVQRKQVSTLRGKGGAIVGRANRQFADTNKEFDDHVARVWGWQKDKEAEAKMRYQLQKMAILRELAGAGLERKQQLAGAWLAAANDLQGGLGNISAVGSKLAGG